MGVIADGSLLDTLRRIKAFGVHLVRLDVRQESSRHAEVISELTRHLGIGDYNQWSEQDKIAFLTTELNSKRHCYHAIGNRRLKLKRCWIPVRSSLRSPKMPLRLCHFDGAYRIGCPRRAPAAARGRMSLSYGCLPAV